MRKGAESIQRHNRWYSLALLLVMLALLIPAVAGADFTITVTGKDYTDPANPVSQPVTAFKWLVQEDNSYDGVGNVGILNKPDSLANNIHKSYAPVVATGDETNAALKLPAGRYFVSVLTPGYTLSGTTVRPGQTTASVTVVKHPIPLAQINVLAFEDNFPVNGTPDLIVERALPGFRVFVFDQAGQVTTDAYGNPVGTLYNSDANGNPILVDGNPTVVLMGPGYVSTGPVGDIVTGNAIVPNLAPGKYGVRVVPQDGKPWVQTTTIEGTPGVDVWIKAGEPRNFIEAGTFAVHVFHGFVLPSTYEGNKFRPLLTGETAGSITGEVVENHSNRFPSIPGQNPGKPFPEAYVSLSDISTNQTLYVARANPDSTFTITGVPPGTYTLTIWDLNLDIIIDFRTVTVTGGVTTALGQVVVPAWFGHYEGHIFLDANNNGILDTGETGLANQALNIRFRDASIYQSTVTKDDGSFRFAEIFPFMKWLVAESDYARYKPTGLTAYVDKGGPLVNGSVPLLETRTDSVANTPGSVGPDFLLQAMNVYADQTNRIDFGRAFYGPGENGGVSGVVYYSVTRAENDPRYGAPETWEPGIPNVTVNLYRVTGYAPVGDTYVPVPEATPFATTTSDSWDNSLPTGCRDTLLAAGIGPVLTPGGYNLNDHPDCAESLPYWNQVKPGVYDGGYIFTDYTDPSDGQTKPLPAGEYIVEVIPPTGYEIVKEEDKNVDFGDVYSPSIPQPQPPAPAPALLPPVCVGADHLVPEFLSLSYLTPADPVPTFYAGQTRPLCDRKLVTLRDGQNTAADFHLFTQVPVAARFVVLVTDDLRTDLRNGSPSYNDKIGIPFVPISIQDFNGNEVVRGYTDEFGWLEALVPSTYSINVPCPTGVSPNMLQVSLNHPGFDPLNPDPFFKNGYPASAANSWDAWTGKTTYVDSPLVPISPGGGNADCNLPDTQPVIVKVTNTTGGGDLGPWIESTATATATAATIEITSLGTQTVPNVEHPLNRFDRSYGFGNSTGTVKLVGAQGAEVLLTGVNWTDATITGTVPVGTAAGEYQLVVVRKDSGKRAQSAITVHVVPAAKVRRVVSAAPVLGEFTSIQAAIDAAENGDLILIEPGTYPENLIMWKPVQLQGYGPLSTIIDAGFFTPEKQVLWTLKLNSIIGDPLTSNVLIPGQDPTFRRDFGSGILVLAPKISNVVNGFTVNLFNNGANQARIDGVRVTGSRLGGGILVNANAHFMKITNNKIASNQGSYGGGIRLGQPSIQASQTAYQSSFNDNIEISHNEIVSNGAIGEVLGAGGGIGIFTGADNYTVSDSLICGNFALLAGAGIDHQGISNNGLIQDNQVIFNESFDEGGGIFLSGELPLTTDVFVSPGAGNVTVNRNLIQGNKSKDLGGGIGLFRYNGLDVQANPTNDPADPDGTWFNARIFNNIIVNNLTGGYGAGIALFDAVSADIINNTIARNDSVSTSELGLGPAPFPLPGITDAITFPMPAGIGVQPTSAGLLTLIGPSIRAGYNGSTGTLVAPLIVNDIIHYNRSFYYNGTVTPPRFPNADTYWDLGVFGQPLASPTVQLGPGFSLLTGAAGATNTTGDPAFIAPYFNKITTSQGAQILGTEFLFTYTPLTLGVSSYLIQNGSAAINKGTDQFPVDAAAIALLRSDYNRDPRPGVDPDFPDIGADEVNTKGKAPGGAGPISVIDALAALQAVVNGPPFSAADIASFDVWPLDANGKPAGDGVLTIADALLILKRAVGLVTW